MLPTITINQEALAPWLGQVTPTGAYIVALVRWMDPRNEKVKAMMVKDYFLLQARFVAKLLPLIDLHSWGRDENGKKVLRPYSEGKLTQEVNALVKLGIVDKLTTFNKLDGKRRRYVKLSKLYYQAEERAERHADRLRKQAQEEGASAPARAREYTPKFEGTPHANLPVYIKRYNKPAAGGASPVAPARQAEEKKRPAFDFDTMRQEMLKQHEDPAACQEIERLIKDAKDKMAMEGRPCAMGKASKTG